MAKIQSILIVDDNEKCLELLSLALQANGAPQVLTESDPRIAIERIGGERIDLVLLDIKMPGLSGFQVLESVRGAGVRTPILMCSGSIRQTDVDRAYSAGCNGYFEKPNSLGGYRALAKTILDYWIMGDVPVLTRCPAAK